MVKEIPLQNGMVALVDDEDYERVSKYTWGVNTNGSRTSFYVGTGSGSSYTVLSRFIMQCNKGDVVIHKDNNPLNCKKENLEVVNRKAVSRKTRGHRNTSSKYKGVCWIKSRRKWRVMIHANNKNNYIGSFSNEDDAARAYNKAALEYFGEHAYQNVIGEDNSVKEVELEPQKQKRKKNKNGFRGVNIRGKRCYVCISIDKEEHYLGVFDTPQQAARAYDLKAYEVYGDKAILNFPEKINEYKKLFESGYVYKPIKKAKSSKYRGVFFHKHTSKWLALITFNGESKYLGVFVGEVEAAKAYDKEAYELHGDKAVLNFPEDYGVITDEI